MSTTSASYLVLPFLNPKTLALYNLKPTSFSLLSSSSNKPHAKPLSISTSFFHSFQHSCSSPFVRNAAVSSEFDVLSDDEGSNFSPDLKLFVGNLPFSVDSEQLAGLFETAGNVEMVEVIYDKVTGRSRGFAFVTMSSAEEVEAAARKFNEYELDGRPLRVNSGPPPSREEFSSRPRGGGREEFSSRPRGGGREEFSSRPRGGGREEFSSRPRGGGREEFSSRPRGGGREEFSSRGPRPRGSGREEFSSRGPRSWGGGREEFSSRGPGSRGGGREEFSSRGPRGGGGEPSVAGNRVYVGNLSWGVDDLALETLFSEQGKVVEAKVVYDRESGRSRGFGFVTYRSTEEVDNAIDSLNGVDLGGRSIRVTAAEARTPRRQF